MNNDIFRSPGHPRLMTRSTSLDLNAICSAWWSAGFRDFRNWTKIHSRVLTVVTILLFECLREARHETALQHYTQRLTRGVHILVPSTPNLLWVCFVRKNILFMLWQPFQWYERRGCWACKPVSKYGTEFKRLQDN